jgi:hypothetical protein
LTVVSLPGFAASIAARRSATLSRIMAAISSGLLSSALSVTQSAGMRVPATLHWPDTVPEVQSMSGQYRQSIMVRL